MDRQRGAKSGQSYDSDKLRPPDSRATSLHCVQGDCPAVALWAGLMGHVLKLGGPDDIEALHPSTFHNEGVMDDFIEKNLPLQVTDKLMHFNRHTGGE